MIKSSQSKVDELREALKAKKEVEARQKTGPSSQVMEERTESEGPPPGSVAAGEQRAKVSASEVSDSAREADDLSVNLRTAEEEAKQHYDKLLRMMAEFENFKKRVTREQEERTKFANEKLLVELLPVLDDLDRVLDHVPQDAASEVKALAEGVSLVRRTLSNVLKKFGLSEIDVTGMKFDPAMHEALSCIQSNEHEDDSIIAVHRKGYKLEDRVIRAAQVTVAKKDANN
jgi:molecular chaperone GrpE